MFNGKTIELLKFETLELERELFRKRLSLSPSLSLFLVSDRKNKILDAYRSVFLTS